MIEEDTPQPIVGDVVNGRTARIEVGKFSGLAGVRSHDPEVEVAYLGDAPRAILTTMTIDGDPYRVTAKLKSEIGGMTVLLAVPEAL